MHTWQSGRRRRRPGRSARIDARLPSRAEPRRAAPSRAARSRGGSAGLARLCIDCRQAAAAAGGNGDSRPDEGRTGPPRAGVGDGGGEGIGVSWLMCEAVLRHVLRPQIRSGKRDQTRPTQSDPDSTQARPRPYRLGYRPTPDRSDTG